MDGCLWWQIIVRLAVTMITYGIQPPLGPRCMAVHIGPISGPPADVLREDFNHKRCVTDRFHGWIRGPTLLSMSAICTQSISSWRTDEAFRIWIWFWIFNEYVRGRRRELTLNRLYWTCPAALRVCRPSPVSRRSQDEDSIRYKIELFTAKPVHNHSINKLIRR